MEGNELIYTDENTPYLMMALGSIVFDDNVENEGLLLSQNSGLTWEMVCF